MSFSKKVKEDALVLCKRCCCLCLKFRGTKIEVHHIRQVSNGGDDTIGNAIPLCFDCHADMGSYDHKHPKGNKYSESELKRRRDNWYEMAGRNIGDTNCNEIFETDKQMYSALLNILPLDGSIDFIRTNNFAGFSFERKRLDNFLAFIHESGNPAFEFLDPDLEGLRVRLLECINSFLLEIATETYPTNNDCNSVPEEWEREQPDRFTQVVEKLHSESQNVIDAYDNIIKAARRKLGILPEELDNPNNSASPAVEQSTTTQVPMLSEEARQLLIATANDSSGRLIKVRTFSGLSVQANGNNFPEGGNPRSEALWEAAVFELCDTRTLQGRRLQR